MKEKKGEKKVMPDRNYLYKGRKPRLRYEISWNLNVTAECCALIAAHLLLVVSRVVNPPVLGSLSLTRCSERPARAISVCVKQYMNQALMQ